MREVLRAVRVMVTTVVMLAPAGIRVAVQGRERGLAHLYRQVGRLLVALGPAFVKAGQVLGTRRDILTPALCAELEVLQDSVPPLDSARSREVLRDIYGPRLTELFPVIDYEPIAGGSVACVYRATDADGRGVALKVLRPEISSILAADLRIMRWGAGLAARLPVLRGVPVTDVVDAMCAAVLAQLDFPREAANLTRLRRDLSAVPRIWVPQVYPELTRPDCVAMEFIPNLDLRTAQRCPVALRRRFAQSALTAIYHMLFVDGFVHCDLHPGNLYFTRGGEVVVLDAGFSVQLTERLRVLFAEFFLNMAVGRGDRCAEIVVDSSAGQRPDADLPGFLTRMAELVVRVHGLPAREFSLIGFATEMFDLQRRHGVHAAPELIFPLLSLLVIEGTIRDLDPDVDFQETAKPVLNRGLFGTRR
ncbi:ABC1 kinase family protein [Actinokineospora globicatena]|uniref:ABC1 kinase family protein n=1 Tax=Actinokineospora globicatena TaxID=103729 RepID=UPI0020A465CA|nr:AarF/UbiB family protein [Actinokineospora globicatena]MCP2303647.1 ubiquinone biosynthesis protein [Actinokineospora globicatena]